MIESGYLLEIMIARLTWAALHTPPMPYRILKRDTSCFSMGFVG